MELNTSDSLYVEKVKSKRQTIISVSESVDAEQDKKQIYDIVRKCNDEAIKSDVLYHVLFGNDGLSLRVCKDIADFLKKSYPSMSQRLLAMIDFACTSEYKVAQHALILFALSTEEAAGDILSSHGLLPVDKFSYFCSNALAVETENLLQGTTTSMRAYVEDVRSAYFTE